MTRYPVTFSGTPAENRRHQPQLGEHSTEILREAGLSDEQIQALIDAEFQAQQATTTDENGFTQRDLLDVGSILPRTEVDLISSDYWSMSGLFCCETHYHMHLSNKIPTQFIS